MNLTSPSPLPVSPTDPTNEAILRVSEDQLQGFVRQPMEEISRLSGIPLNDVINRIRAMLRAGTIRRVRQTFLTTNLAPGALVAWQVPPDRLDPTFDFFFKHDPFTGHVVIRSTDPGAPGAAYRLWTTLKVPQGFSMQRHCQLLSRLTGAGPFRLMPAQAVFTLGVGHSRRKNLQPGDRAPTTAEPRHVEVTPLTPEEWRVLGVMKREFTPEELTPNLWDARAAELGLSPDTFCTIGHTLQQKGVMGRFSTFLEHVKPLADGERVTRFNALFHWAVPPGLERQAGMEVARHYIMTHAYWREGGPEFNHVNIMGVAHGTDKERVRAHKAAIDQHLAQIPIPVSYTNIFWGGRSEIKPSEFFPDAYETWARSHHTDPASLRS
ncbi:MAG: Lrp/AsnC family transcriptional regulator [Verrucomicrobiia bacterium]